jgi:DnaJ like chaperone protein
MSLWTRLANALAALREGESLSSVFDRARKPPEKRVAFAIAVIALGAKMAKADGRVTRDEVAAFREVFRIAPEEEENAARVFNLARQDVTGYRDYARKIGRMFDSDSAVLTDLMEGLFHVAAADGAYHPDEDGFLRNVAEDFGLGEACFRRLRARFVPGATPDPYAVLGVDPEASLDEIPGRLASDRARNPSRSDDRAGRARRGDQAGRGAADRCQPGLGGDRRRSGSVKMKGGIAMRGWRNRVLLPALVLAGALATQAQEDPPAGPMERMIEELANQMFREMLGDMAPTLRDLQGLMGEVENYGPPMLLPNGDILIPRKPDAPPPGQPDAPDAGEPDAEPGAPLEL